MRREAVSSVTKLGTLALALVALCPLWLPHLPIEGFWLARALAVLGGAWVVAQCNRGPLPVLASPAFTLPLLVLVFYSLLPAVYVSLYLGGPVPLPPMARPETLRILNDVVIYPAYATASAGEAWVLGFVGIGLLVGLVFDRLIPVAAGPCDPCGAFAPAPNWRRCVQTSLVFINKIKGDLGHSPRWVWAIAQFRDGSMRRAVGIIPVAAANRWDLASAKAPLGLILAGGLAFRIGKMLALGSVVDTLPPLVMLGMAQLVLGGIQRRQWRIWAVLGLMAGGTLLFPFHIKAFALLAGTALLLWALVLRGWARMTVAVILVLAPVVATTAVQVRAAQHPKWRPRWCSANRKPCVAWISSCAKTPPEPARGAPDRFISLPDWYREFCGPISRPCLWAATMPCRFAASTSPATPPPSP
jgi:hypothetical protein